MIKAIAQNCAKTEGPTKKNNKINFEVNELRVILHLLTLIKVFRKHRQYDGQVCQNLHFLEFLKKRKMANFKSKNLCDKSLKIQNLKRRISWIFRYRRYGVLYYFCRRCFHSEIFLSKLPVLKNFKKTKKNMILFGKIRPIDIFLSLLFHPSFWHVQKVRLGPPSFDRGLGFYGDMTKTK